MQMLLFCVAIPATRGQSAFGEPCGSMFAEYYTQDEMMGMRLIAVCNLKPRALVGYVCACCSDSQSAESILFDWR